MKKILGSMGGWVALVVLASTQVVHADLYSPHPHGATTRTYFGRPGSGPYGAPGGYAPAAGMQNPYTCKLFGIRCCKSPESQMEDQQRRVARAEARAAAIINRANAHCCPIWGNLAGGACGGPCGCPPQGCGNCFLFGCCNKHQGGGGGYAGGPMASPLPGMNREDAVRYLEGFQYYPPQHLLRSPRDFHMFDVKYGIGQ